MDKGLLAWRIATGFMALVIVYGVVIIGVGTMSGDYDCPIIRENGTEMVFCWSVENWSEYCPTIGCEYQRFWCGRPGCQCQEEFMHND